MNVILEVVPEHECGTLANLPMCITCPHRHSHTTRRSWIVPPYTDYTLQQTSHSALVKARRRALAMET
eukprot:6214025-Pleurochrysis_carterae.AAC.3